MLFKNPCGYWVSRSEAFIAVRTFKRSMAPRLAPRSDEIPYVKARTTSFKEPTPGFLPLAVRQAD
jgi:hypothetical protein